MVSNDTPAQSSMSADVAVIGFGKGGKTLAAALGRMGRRVVMIEQSDRMYGGTCINIGCVPTKSMVFRAEEAPSHPSPEIYHDAVIATAALTDRLRAENFTMLDSLATVEVLTGTASFVDAHTLVVRGTATTTVTADIIVVGTGSEPVWPEVPGLAGNPRAVTSTEMLGTEQLPGRVVVLGGGYVGLEFAAMYAAYGSSVTILERRPGLLQHEDTEISAAALDLVTSAGVAVLPSAVVTSVDGSRVHYEREGLRASISADTILVALGRRPVTAGLNLQNAGITTRPDGSIDVDDHLRTSQSHIFAVGDVNGGPQFTYVSLDDYRIVLDQLTGAGTRRVSDRAAVPYVLFLTPPLARVGLTERAALDAGHRIKVACLPVEKMATVPRARIVNQTRGLMKVVVDASTDFILGAALLSYDAHEVINTVSLAMRYGISASQLRDEIFTHPSMTEAFNQLLDSLRDPA